MKICTALHQLSAYFADFAMDYYLSYTSKNQSDIILQNPGGLKPAEVKELVDLDSKFVDPDETFKDYMDKIMKGEIESNSIVQGFDAIGNIWKL